MQQQSKRGKPKKAVQMMLPGKKCLSAVYEGSECSADSALRVTERDFLYNAGFQRGRPKGCSAFIAYQTHSKVEN